ncbi:MrpH family fimbial adhesin [Serratia quinivorans]
MVNAAPIWDVPLSRGGVYSWNRPGIPANQLRFHVWGNGVGGGGSLAYIYYVVPPSLSPPKPASCQALQAPSLDFGTIDPKEISGKKATSQVLVWCDKKASVRVRFMTREGLAIFQMDNGLSTYLKIDDNPGTAGSYQTVAENASSPARAFNLSAELLGTSGSVKPGAFSYTAVVRVDIL